MLETFASDIVLEKNELKRLKKLFYIVGCYFFFFLFYINAGELPRKSIQCKQFQRGASWSLADFLALFILRPYLLL